MHERCGLSVSSQTSYHRIIRLSSLNVFVVCLCGSHRPKIIRYTILPKTYIHEMDGSQLKAYLQFVWHIRVRWPLPPHIHIYLFKFILLQALKHPNPSSRNAGISAFDCVKNAPYRMKTERGREQICMVRGD